MLQREQVGRNAIRRAWAWPQAFGIRVQGVYQVWMCERPVVQAQNHWRYRDNGKENELEKENGSYTI